MHDILYGRNAVREALYAQRRHFYNLHLANNIKDNALMQELVLQAEKLNIPVKRVPKQQLDKIGRGHQGVALEASNLPDVHVNDVLAQAEKANQLPFLLAMDHLEDPQNVGALIRTAEIVGVHGIILPNRRSVGITPTVVKASAGATEHISITIVTNLVQSLKALKKAGLWIVGVEKDENAQPYHQVDLNMPLVIVMGQEGSGMTHLVRQTCDLLLELPTKGKIESLNVSAAGAVIMYQALQARQ